MSNELAIDQEAEIEAINPNVALFNSERLNQLTQFAAMMAKGRCAVPNHLSGNQGDCLAIAMQAAQWGMNPFAVAQKTHLVNGVLGYEAQLVNAIISSSRAIQGRFHYEYGGDWDGIAGAKSKNEKNTAGKWVTKKGWADNQEDGLFIRVGATLKDETEITWLEKLFLKSVNIRNSPLWVSDPKQQIAYLGVKKWARLYAPAVIMGVYTPDEIEPKEPRDITPVFTANDLNAKLLKKAAIDVTAEKYSLNDFTKDLKASNSPEQIKLTLGKVSKLSEIDKPAARDAYKSRIEDLKAESTPSPALTEALEAVERSENLRELSESLNFSSEIGKEGEMDIFQKAYEDREIIIKGER